MKPRPLKPAVLLLLPLLLAANPCAAQVKLKPGPSALTRQELKTCILREDELNARDAALRRAATEQDASTAALSQEAKDLAEVMRSIDPASQDAVDAFNRRNDERNRRVAEHNKRTEALNSTQAELQAANADYMATCVSRPYLLKDKEAVLKELGRSPEKQGEPKSKGKGTGASKSDA